MLHATLGDSSSLLVTLPDTFEALIGVGSAVEAWAVLRRLTGCSSRWLHVCLCRLNRCRLRTGSLLDLSVRLTKTLVRGSLLLHQLLVAA